MQSRSCLRLRGGLLPRLLPCVLAFAACDSAEPPDSCGFIPQVTVRAGESYAVTACFNDPNGDRLTYSATSSDPGVATATASGNTITVTAVAPGNVTISVTASDPGGLEGRLSFRVMVPNRPPVALDRIPTFNTTVGETGSLDVSPYFREPDGQPLTYEAFSSDSLVVTASLNGSVVTLLATGVGTAIVVITARDPEGLSEVQPVTVAVRLPEERFRDDFDTPATLTKWLLTNATAAVRQGRLELTSTDDVGIAERSLAAPLSSWKIDVSMGRQETTNSLVGVWWETGDPRYTVLSFEIGGVLSNNYNFFIFDRILETAFRISDFSGASDAINESAGELTEIQLSFSEGRFRGVAGTTELFNTQSLLFSRVWEELTLVALISLGAPDRTARFDWVEVDGTTVSDPALDRVAPKTPGFDALRRLVADGELKVVDIKLSDLLTPTPESAPPPRSSPSPWPVRPSPSGSGSRAPPPGAGPPPCGPSSCS